MELKSTFNQIQFCMGIVKHCTRSNFAFSIHTGDEYTCGDDDDEYTNDDDESSYSPFSKAVSIYQVDNIILKPGVTCVSYHT